MSKFLVVAAVLTLAACGEKKSPHPELNAMDSAAAAAPAMADTTKMMDTTKMAGDTAKKP